MLKYYLPENTCAEKDLKSRKQIRREKGPKIMEVKGKRKGSRVQITRQQVKGAGSLWAACHVRTQTASNAYDETRIKINEGIKGKLPWTPFTCFFPTLVLKKYIKTKNFSVQFGQLLKNCSHFISFSTFSYLIFVSNIWKQKKENKKRRHKNKQRKKNAKSWLDLIKNHLTPYWL